MSEDIVSASQRLATSYVETSSTTSGETVLADLPGDASPDRDRRCRAIGLHPDRGVLDELRALPIEQQQRRRVGAEDAPERVQEPVREIVEAQLRQGRVGDRLDLLQTLRELQEAPWVSIRSVTSWNTVTAPAIASSSLVRIGAESTSIITVVPSARSIAIGSPITMSPALSERLIG